MRATQRRIGNMSTNNATAEAAPGPALKHAAMSRAGTTPPLPKEREKEREEKRDSPSLPLYLPQICPFTTRL